jgi:hypothetical protein
LAERLDRAGALDDHPVARRARKPRDKRDRRSEDERAGGRDDHHGQRSYGIAAERPSDPGSGERDGQEDARVAVGHAHQRRPLGLGLLHQAHERGVGALGRRAVRADVERRAGVRRAAQRGHAVPQRHRQRLATERAGVDDCLVADDRAVDGDHFARAHEHDVAPRDRLDRHLLQRRVDVPAPDPWCSFDQSGELAACAAGRRRLECGAAGEHQADHRAGKLLVQRERSNHGD